MRIPRYLQALEALRKEAPRYSSSCPDNPRVQNPVDFLAQEFKVSRTTALSYLKELEKRKMVLTERSGYNGNGIEWVYLRQVEPPSPFHEVDEEHRLLSQLWEHQRPSRNGQPFVHSHMFAAIQGAADLLQPRFYHLLDRFVEREWISIVPITQNGKPTSRILYLELTEHFPEAEALKK